jgi:excisionase family DNA binding protein
MKLDTIDIIRAKEILTVRETALLLNYSVRTVYRLIDNGTLKSINLSSRMTRIKSSELNNRQIVQEKE